MEQPLPSFILTMVQLGCKGGFAQKLQATTKGGGLFRIELPSLAPEREFLCKVCKGEALE
jgi:hypothetical protein